MASTKKVSISKFKHGHFHVKEDVLAVEEPLEISLHFFEDGKKKQQSISITMRTPGCDVELALGFLYTEGIISNYDQIEITTSLVENQIQVHLKDTTRIDLEKLKRNFYTTSSCGVCGKSSIDAIHTIVSGHKILPLDATELKPAVLLSLKDKINEYQSNFSQTGGIHASALFDLEGNILSIFEDVGRHNALDKLIGHHLMANALDFTDKILLLSGRASFELIQKAIMSKISAICAIGAPSSLAVDLANEFGITLIGFLKNDSFNVYNNAINIQNEN